MSITTDLDAWWVQEQGYENSNRAKGRFWEIMNEIGKRLDELQQMNLNGDFDKLPATVKAKFVWAWGILDTARDTVKADAGFMEALNWKP